MACDFATIDTVMLRRYYLLFFIDVTSREVFFAGITTNPTGPWTTQAARNLFLRHSGRLSDARALGRDRGSQFIEAFAERLIGSLRRELLDRTIIWNRRQLQYLVVNYMQHYNTHRPHRSLNQRPPLPAKQDTGDSPLPPTQVIRSTRCNDRVSMPLCVKGKFSCVSGRV